MKVIIQTPLSHDNQIYAVDSIADLPNDVASPLIKAGVVKRVVEQPQQDAGEKKEEVKPDEAKKPENA
jgi:hypothetical protein